MKRLFDLAIVVPGLIVLSPLLLLVAVCVKCASPGPVLFRQQRIGLGGRSFLIYKFRTMVAGRDVDGPQFTVSNDPRITKVGRWLRRSKLDELPQLLNVLAGDMSLVGPRPQVSTIVSHYPTEVRDIVFSVRPGITDPATIRFRHEEELLSRVADPERFHLNSVLPYKLSMYVHYVQQQNLRSDMLILLQTVACVVRSRRATRPASVAPNSATVFST